MTRKLLNLALIAALLTVALAVGSTGNDVRQAASVVDTAISTQLVPGQTYHILVPGNDRPQCRDTDPYGPWEPCPTGATWFPDSSFDATYLGQSWPAQARHGGGTWFLFDTPYDMGEGQVIHERWVQ